MSEAEIIDKLREGSEKAFRELVDQYQQLVVNTCFGLLHNTEDAEDVAQDVFIEVFRSVDKFRADAKISTWLYRIAVNRSLNFIRDNKRRKWFQSFDDLVEAKKKSLGELVSGNTENPEFDLENSQRSLLLHEAIDALPENQRVAFTLNKYEDLAYKEIAEVMKLSVSSVESLIHRAKKNLQKKLYYCYKKKCI
ncbi:sigma-70 family RNA polymerase sigma factor [Mariniphaga sediminis]|jgi:RNA polymerase sigma-70 factor (ECF subfamily)|uniref:RNA polymerase sigma factor n=1 Tax=Mariniphaga sediminis TaxID=1628158 RepID=A0A399D5G8_9BACT|nr:sigma-70 family RNA polymerase sigma factor [Mariniphaga sediminis]RIH65981.1 sigma-70 family RNA polymerase sigma factor [Mariniphaga sediminis]